ncbi:S-layer homology domain-containing protein [Falsibacillus pallidus]|uniref:S-layer homology domain-containing protein n=1 Tax=Falsibacillus pallidus TaxID=493781 RepID=UPI003D968594
MKKNESLKKFLAASVSATIAAASAAGGAAFAAEKEKSFTDVGPGIFGYDSITKLANDHIIDGYPDGTFKPNQPLKRGQAAKLLTLALQLKADTTKLPFTDVSDTSPWKSYIEAVVSNHIFNGMSDHTFHGNYMLSREQMATILVRAFGLTAISGEKEHSFNDSSQISASHASNVQILFQHGITTGRSDGSFGPRDPVTRAQFAVFLDRALHTSLQYDQAKVENTTSDSVKINGTYFHISPEVAPLFSSKNLDALKGAAISFHALNKTITSIDAITINASGKEGKEKEFDSQVILDGEGLSVKEITVNGDFVTLQNLQIQNHLTLSSNVQHDFYAKNVSVKEEAFINGGDDHTVVFEDSTLAKMSISKENVRISARGKTEIKQMSVNNNAVIEGESTSKFESVTIGEKVEKLNLNAEVASLQLLNTKPLELTGDFKAKNVILPKGTKLEEAVKDAAGMKGKIEKVDGVPNGSNDSSSGDRNTPPRDTTAPAEVQNFSGEAQDEKVSLTWDVNTESDFSRYEIYYAEGPSVTRSSGHMIQITDKNTTEKEIAGLTNDTTYTFAIYAVDTTGNYSQEATVHLQPSNTTHITDGTNPFEDKEEYDRDYSIDISENGEYGASSMGNEATINGDLTLTGNVNNLTVQNLKINGTLTLDPGDDGEVEITNVEADDIEILSGKMGTIVFEGAKIGTINVKDNNGVKLKALGENQVSEINLAPTASNDQTAVAMEGAFGEADININSPLELQTIGEFSAKSVIVSPVQSTSDKSVKLTGDFSKTGGVIVTKPAKVESSSGTNLPIITLSISESSNNHVSFSGDFSNTALKATMPSSIHFNEGTSFTSLQAEESVTLSGEVSSEMTIQASDHATIEAADQEVQNKLDQLKTAAKSKTIELVAEISNEISIDDLNRIRNARKQYATAMALGVQSSELLTENLKLTMAETQIKAQTDKLDTIKALVTLLPVSYSKTTKIYIDDLKNKIELINGKFNEAHDLGITDVVIESYLTQTLYSRLERANAHIHNTENLWEEKKQDAEAKIAALDYGEITVANVQKAAADCNAAIADITQYKKYGFTEEDLKEYSKFTALQEKLDQFRSHQTQYLSDAKSALAELDANITPENLEVVKTKLKEAEDKVSLAKEFGWGDQDIDGIEKIKAVKGAIQLFEAKMDVSQVYEKTVVNLLGKAPERESLSEEIHGAESNVNLLEEGAEKEKLQAKIQSLLEFISASEEADKLSSLTITRETIIQSEEQLNAAKNAVEKVAADIKSKEFFAQYQTIITRAEDKIKAIKEEVAAEQTATAAVIKFTSAPYTTLEEVEAAATLKEEASQLVSSLKNEEIKSTLSQQIEQRWNEISLIKPQLEVDNALAEANALINDLENQFSPEKHTEIVTKLTEVQQKVNNLDEEFKLIYQEKFSAYQGRLVNIELNQAGVSLNTSIPSSTTNNINLPTTGEFGTTITWTSDNPNALNSTGEVNRPAIGQEDAAVTLTAVVSKGDLSKTFTYQLSVLAEMDESSPVHLSQDALHFLDVTEDYFNGIDFSAWNEPIPKSLIEFEFDKAKIKKEVPSAVYVQMDIQRHDIFNENYVPQFEEHGAAPDLLDERNPQTTVKSVNVLMESETSEDLYVFVSLFNENHEFVGYQKATVHTEKFEGQYNTALAAFKEKLKAPDSIVFKDFLHLSRNAQEDKFQEYMAHIGELTSESLTAEQLNSWIQNINHPMGEIPADIPDFKLVTGTPRTFDIYTIDGIIGWQERDNYKILSLTSSNLDIAKVDEDNSDPEFPWYELVPQAAGETDLEVVVQREGSTPVSFKIHIVVSGENATLEGLNAIQVPDVNTMFYSDEKAYTEEVYYHMLKQIQDIAIPDYIQKRYLGSELAEVLLKQRPENGYSMELLQEKINSASAILNELDIERKKVNYQVSLLSNGGANSINVMDKLFKQPLDKSDIEVDYHLNSALRNYMEVNDGILYLKANTSINSNIRDYATISFTKDGITLRNGTEITIYPAQQVKEPAIQVEEYYKNMDVYKPGQQFYFRVQSDYPLHENDVTLLMGNQVIPLKWMTNGDAMPLCSYNLPWFTGDQELKVKINIGGKEFIEPVSQVHDHMGPQIAKIEKLSDKNAIQITYNEPVLFSDSFNSDPAHGFKADGGNIKMVISDGNKVTIYFDTSLDNINSISLNGSGSGTLSDESENKYTGIEYIALNDGVNGLLDELSKSDWGINVYHLKGDILESTENPLIYSSFDVFPEIFTDTDTEDEAAAKLQTKLNEYIKDMDITSAIVQNMQKIVDTVNDQVQYRAFLELRLPDGNSVYVMFRNSMTLTHPGQGGSGESIFSLTRDHEDTDYERAGGLKNSIHIHTLDDSVDHYEIYRSNGDDPEILLATIQQDNEYLTYEDMKNLQSNTLYHYRVKAIDSNDNEMASSELEFKSANDSDEVPLSLTDVKAVWDEEQSAVQLTWSPCTSSDLASYKVYRTEVDPDQDEDWESLPVAISKDATSFIDETVSKGKMYNYRVMAVDESGKESYAYDQWNKIFTGTEHFSFTQIEGNNVKIDANYKDQHFLVIDTGQQSGGTDLFSVADIDWEVNEDGEQICSFYLVANESVPPGTVEIRLKDTKGTEDSSDDVLADNVLLAQVNEDGTVEIIGTRGDAGTGSLSQP